MLNKASLTQPRKTRIRGHIMKVTCDKCECDMKITSSFRYHCPECKNEIEMVWVQDINKKHWDEHKKNIEWARVKGTEVIIAK